MVNVLEYWQNIHWKRTRIVYSNTSTRRNSHPAIHAITILVLLFNVIRTGAHPAKRNPGGPWLFHSTLTKRNASPGTILPCPGIYQASLSKIGNLSGTIVKRPGTNPILPGTIVNRLGTNTNLSGTNTNLSGTTYIWWGTFYILSGTTYIW